MKVREKGAITLDAQQWEGPGHDVPGVEWDDGYDAYIVRTKHGAIVIRPDSWVVTMPDGTQRVLDDAVFRSMYEEAK